jgi:hypothetical protein
MMGLVPYFVFGQFIEQHNHFRLEWGEMMRFGGNVKGFFDVEQNTFSTVVDRVPFNYLGSRKSKVRIKNFQNFELINAGDIGLRADDKRVSLLGILDIGNNAVAFSSQRNTWQRSYANYYHQFNHFSINETIEGKPIQKYISPYGLNFIGQLDFTSSENYNYGAAYFIVPARADDYISMGYLLFDDKNKLSEQHVHLLSYKQYELSILNQYLNDNGEYFLVGKQYFRRDPLRNWSPLNRTASQMKIFHATKAGFEELAIQSNDFAMKSIALDTDKEGNLVGIGFYADIVGSNVRGTFFFKYDINQKKLIHLQKNPLSIEMMAQESTSLDRNLLLANRLRIARNMNNFNEFNINFFEQTQDGGYIAVAEQVEVEYRNTDKTNSETPTSRFDEYFYHDDLIIFKFNSEGEIDWVKRIPKHQQSKNDGGYYLSSVEYLTKDRLYIYFNDHRNNYNSDGEFNAIGKLKPTTLTRKNNVIAGITVDIKTGNVDRKALNGRGALRTVLVPTVARENLADKTLLIYGNHGRKHRFGKIEFF